LQERRCFIERAVARWWRRGSISEAGRRGGLPLLGEGGIELEAEVVAGVGEADAADEVADEFAVVRDFTALHIGAEKIAKHAAEIFVTRITQEAARVGEHADKATE